MQKLDLNRIIELKGLKITELGKKLYPNNKHPYAAITRVRNGLASLDSEQIAILSELVDIPIGLLFDDADWHMSTHSKNQKNIIQFRSYDFFAELDCDTMITTVSRNGKLYFSKIVHSKNIILTEYLSQLTDLIIKHK